MFPCTTSHTPLCQASSLHGLFCSDQCQQKAALSLAHFIDLTNQVSFIATSFS